ncbi:hypothetical protein BDN72DRAFT_845392, partial [Pluteus cervinus]
FYGTPVDASSRAEAGYNQLQYPPSPAPGLNRPSLNQSTGPTPSPINQTIQGRRSRILGSLPRSGADRPPRGPNPVVKAVLLLWNALVGAIFWLLGPDKSPWSKMAYGLFAYMLGLMSVLVYYQFFMVCVRK